MRAFAVAFSGILLLLPSAAFGQNADKLAGTWRSTVKVAGHDHVVKVSLEGDEWKLESSFLKNDKVLGIGVGYEVNLFDGGLSFKHKLVKKPSGWTDSSDVQRLAWNGDRLEWIKGKEKRLYNRVSDAAVAQATPKADAKNPPTPAPMPMPQADPQAVPASFDGIWMGSIPNGKLTLLLNIKKNAAIKKGDKSEHFVVEGHLTNDGKFAGHFRTASLKFESAKGSDLHFAAFWNDHPGVPRPEFSKLSLLRGKGGLALTVTGAKNVTLTTLLKPTDASEIANLPAPPPPPMVVAKAPPEPATQPAPDNSIRPKTKSVKAIYVLEKPAPLPKIAPTPIDSTFAAESYLINVSAQGGRISLLDRQIADHFVSVFDIDSKKKLWAASVVAFGSASLSPDGKLVAVSVTTDGTANSDSRAVRICDGGTGKVLHTLKGAHFGGFHPTKPFIVRHEAKQFSLVDLKTGKEKWSVQVGFGSHIQFDPTGTYCVIDGVPDDEILRNVSRVYDAETGMKVLDLSVEKCSSRCGAFSPDGKRLALYCSNYYRSVVKIYDLETGEELCSTPTFPGTNEDYHPLDFSPDGKTIAVCCGGKTVRFYDSSTGKLQRFHALDDQPYYVYVLADNDRVVTGGRDIRIYRIATAVTPMQAASQGLPPAPDTEPPNP
jgi:hypothetical protein